MKKELNKKELEMVVGGVNIRVIQEKRATNEKGLSKSVLTLGSGVALKEAKGVMLAHLIAKK